MLITNNALRFDSGTAWIVTSTQQLVTEFICRQNKAWQQRSFDNPFWLVLSKQHIDPMKNWVLATPSIKLT
jgi:hypothetical protein